MTKKIITMFVAVVFVLSAFAYITPAQAANDHNGKVVRMEGLSTLYYVASDGKRYVFPNVKTFSTWFPDFDDVETLTQEELQGLQLGGNVVYRPGVVLVKITTDPKVYAVSSNGRLRWVKTEQIATNLYGSDWNQLVDDIPDSFFTNYVIGEEIDDANEYDPDDEINNCKTIDKNRGMWGSNGLKSRTKKCNVAKNGNAYGFYRNCERLGAYDDEDDDDTNPYITSIKVENGGNGDNIDEDDIITINFSEAIDPESIDDDLTAGSYVNNVEDDDAGAISVTNSGRVIIEGIATFDAGTVGDEGEFEAKLELSSNAKTLTITLTDGDDVEVGGEFFSASIQIGNTVRDEDGNAMQPDTSSVTPTGTFLEEDDEDEDEINEDADLYIVSIEVVSGGTEGYIDVGDELEITFNRAIDPESVHEDLDEGDEVEDVDDSDTGGVTVDEDGILEITDIAAFDVGEVDTDRRFDTRLELNSSGKILTVVLTDGSDVEVEDEDFDDAEQIGGVVEDDEGEEMDDDSKIDDPEGSFMSDSNDDNDPPYITEIEVVEGGDDGYIDVGDKIEIVFNKSIEPESVHEDLEAGDSVEDVDDADTGGVTVDDDGILEVTDILRFDVGDVDDDSRFETEISLNSNAKMLTIELTDGDEVMIEDEEFEDTDQIGDTVEDENGNEMEDDSNIDDPTGTFGENDDEDGPIIESIKIYNDGEDDFINEDDYIKIKFNEAIAPESVHDDLEEGDDVDNVQPNETGGVIIDNDVLTITDIAEFDLGDVEADGEFEVELALNDDADVLTITLTDGDEIEIDDEDIEDAEQIGGTIEDEFGNEMDDDNIDDPTGSFEESDDTDGPIILEVELDNGNESDVIDVGDTITIIFDEAVIIDMDGNFLEAGDTLEEVENSEAGGVSVSSEGRVEIEDIATFWLGDVEDAGDFEVTISLSSDGEELTIEVTDGSDIDVDDHDFVNTATQVRGYVEDEFGNEMEYDTDNYDLTGSF